MRHLTAPPDDDGGTREGQRDGGVSTGAESQHIHRVHIEQVQNGEDVPGGVLGGEGPAGGSEISSASRYLCPPALSRPRPRLNQVP